MVDRFPLRLSRSAALRDYRLRSKHATQHLLTLVVGTEAVKRGAKAPEAMPVSWNPRSREAAAARARTFALHTSLGWAAGSLDGYILDLAQSDPLLLEPGL